MNKIIQEFLEFKNISSSTNTEKINELTAWKENIIKSCDAKINLFEKIKKSKVIDIDEAITELQYNE